MRRKYSDCQRADGDCTACSLVNDGRDCHGRQITHLEWCRRSAGLTQGQVAERADVNIRLIQKVEGGDYLAGNLTAKNLIAIADALEVDAHSLL